MAYSRSGICSTPQRNSGSLSLSLVYRLVAIVAWMGQRATTNSPPTTSFTSGQRHVWLFKGGVTTVLSKPSRLQHLQLCSERAFPASYCIFLMRTIGAWKQSTGIFTLSHDFSNPNPNPDPDLNANPDPNLHPNPNPYPNPNPNPNPNPIVSCGMTLYSNGYLNGFKCLPLNWCPMLAYSCKARVYVDTVVMLRISD